MGRAQLGSKWLRRIQRTTGLDVVQASGNGSYRFEFTTADHQHGWFDLKAYRNGGEVWALYGGCPNFTSCRRLFGDPIQINGR